MGMFKEFVSQTKKPEGFLGRMMLNGMNSGHAQMADWGLAFLPEIAPAMIADLGCGGGRNAGELLKRYPDAIVAAVDYSDLSVEKRESTTNTPLRPDAAQCSRATYPPWRFHLNHMALPLLLRQFTSGRDLKSASGR